jgi:uncharacterized protein
MKIGALVDVHGAFDAVRRIMARHPDVVVWVCVGDVCDADGRYESPPAPLHWIKGNNEDFDVVAALTAGLAERANLCYLPNGQLREIEGVRLAGLGGTFAPTWYGTAADQLPRPGLRVPVPGQPFPKLARDDKRRHFVREEVDACSRLRGLDLFLTHEAPRPFLLEGRGRRHDAGKPVINGVLAAARPRLHLFGHHHVPSEGVRDGVPSIGLDLVTRSYLLIESVGWCWQRCET